ncbi:hypothetical protein ABPG77_000524 [Micractinium sp. CCAP 211/92]
MATTVARKASLPASVALVKAWGAVPPTLCGSSKAEPEAVKRVPLPSEAHQGSQEESDAPAHRPQPQKSFKMHVGAFISIPTRDARDLPQMAPQPQRMQQQAVVDPFEGLPFRGFAERLGSAVLPSIEAARQAEREAKLAARQAADEAEVVVPEVPHVLPFTRWAAHSTKFRSTFIAEPPKERKKARLSWYHPDDTMVPRDWWSGGLLADLKYYSPFGWGGSSAAAEKQH